MREIVSSSLLGAVTAWDRWAGMRSLDWAGLLDWSEVARSPG
jgi:hypothetical protein